MIDTLIKQQFIRERKYNLYVSGSIENLMLIKTRKK